ncbi:MAG: hypothetical protein AB8I80_23240, partial [Anaerolineae bacterium]
MAVVVTVSAVLALGCQGVLGIESDRKLDQAYPPGGYEGCTEAPDCDGCTLESHRCVCEGGDPVSCKLETDPEQVCATVSEPCLRCVCGSCESEYRTCSEDRGCFAILDCIGKSECDPDPSSADTCYRPEYCQETIDENGGLAGKSFERLKKVTACAEDAECPCGGDECSASNGCSGCADCWATCRCEGNDDATCQDRCTPPECSPDNDCNNCADCMAQCQCEGDSYETCEASCGSQSCTPANGC